MVHRPLGSVLRQLPTLAASTSKQETTDGQLLDQFLRWQDEAAFAVLLRRHGPLVWGLCGRLLRNPADAADAFQATFLVLARKAGAIRQRHSVASWLYGVAYRLSLKVRAAGVRRRQREQLAGDGVASSFGDDSEGTTMLDRLASATVHDDPATLAARHDLRTLLDEELERLPAKYREPLILCYLEGKTNEQAARELGWPAGTMSRRLATARQLLRAQISQRGLALASVTLAAALAEHASGATVPPALLRRTAEVAGLFALGEAGASALVSGRSVALAEGMLLPARLVKFTIAVVVIVVLGFAATGTGISRVSQQSASAAAPPMAFTLAQGDEPKPPEQDQPLPELTPKQKEQLKVDAAVASGLKWLVRKQEKDGRWSLPTGQNDVAGTAFGLLPLLRAGETPRGRENLYAVQVDKGLKYLLAQQAEDGGFGHGYQHALATMALCEAYARTSDAALKKPAEKALNYIIKGQGPNGGWRYQPGQPGDTSVTAWCVQALKIGERAGVKVPQETWDKVSKYLDSVATPEGGYGYTGPQAAPATTAGGMYCRLLLGTEPDDETLKKGVGYLHKLPPSANFQNMYFYYLAAHVMKEVPGEGSENWQQAMRKVLLGRQDQEGGWSAAGDAWGGQGGPVMISSLSLLILEMSYPLSLELPPLEPRDLKPAEVQRLWKELAEATVFQSADNMRVLAAGAQQTLPFLQQRLRPVPPADPKAIARAVAELDSTSFAVRKAPRASCKNWASWPCPRCRKYSTASRRWKSASAWNGC